MKRPPSLCIVVGEFFGTFLLVFFGIGSATATVLFHSHVGLFEIAMVWGIAITLGIYATRNLSGAHLNPAVSLAMAVAGRMPCRLLPTYFIGQLAGAIAGGVLLHLLFGASLAAAEAATGLGHGTTTALSALFCEAYPNAAGAVVTTGGAFLAEASGVFVLVILIFALTEGCNLGRPSDAIAPLFIGLAVTILISVIAPLTNAGLNPARDLGPRLIGSLLGWKEIAWNRNILLVYTVAPLCGGAIAGGAAAVFTRWVTPVLDQWARQGAEPTSDGTILTQRTPDLENAM